MPPPDLVIAVHATRPLTDEYQGWLRTKAQEVAKALPQFSVVVFVSEGDSEAHNRNTIAHEFLKNKNAAWLWLVEPDLVWSAADPAALIATRRPVIGILHTNCEEWSNWQATFYEGSAADEHGILAVPEVSANGLLIHRTAFERVLAKSSLSLDFRDENSWDPHHAFFQQARVAFKGLNRLLRAGHFFQWLCRECGIGIYVHTAIRLERIGPDGLRYPKRGQVPNLVVVPAPDAGQYPLKRRPGKFVICLQYWEGDKTAMERLEKFIAEFSVTTCEHVVIRRACPPGLRYPTGPNTLAFTLIKEAAAGAEWAEDAKCILLMEPDCVPVARNWIDQLSEEWDRAAGQGKLVLGHWQKESGGHINGNLMFDPCLANAIDLGETPPRRPWDIAYPPLFETHWARTGLLKNLYRRTNVTAAEIETPAVGTRRPVLIHGVRDESAWNYAAKLP